MDFRPLHDAHAISHVVFALELARPVTGAEVQRLEKRSEAITTALPRKRQMQSATIKFTLGPGRTDAPSPQQNDLTGIAFDRVSPIGTVAETFMVNSNILAATVSEYDRWAIVWPRIEKYFSVALETLTVDNFITVIGMEVLDRFIGRDGINEPNIRTVLDAQTKYIVGNVFDCRGLWHSHHGFFRQTTFSQPHNMLTNLNIGVGTALDLKTRHLDITCNSRLLLEVPFGKGTPQADVLKTVGEGMNILHTENKDMIRNILSSEARVAINLTDNV